MPSGKLRRISELDQKATGNALFPILEDLIHQNIVLSPRREDEEYESLYTIKRITEESPTTFQDTLQRMPEDIKDLAKNPKSIGGLELDLIDFILNYKDHRVLSIVGPIGVGKSTFIHYVLKTLRNRSASLSYYLPIIINCLATATISPSILDFIYQIQSYCENFFPIINQSAFDDTIKSQSIACAPTINTSSFLKLMRSIKNQLIGKHEPLLIFDNVDQLHPLAVTQICDLGRGVFLNEGIGVIIAMRPTTYRTRVELSHDMGTFQKFSIPITPPDLFEVIKYRLHNVASSFDKKHASIRIGNIRLNTSNILKTMDKLCNDFLGPQEQLLLITKLSNNNIRKALLIFERFFRSDVFPVQRLIPIVPTTKDDGIEYLPRNILIVGLMRSGNRMFFDCDQITNIYFFQTKDTDYHYLIVYRVLSMLALTDRTTKANTIYKWSMSYGYTSQQVTEVLDMLLNRGLACSPESEVTAENIEYITITSCGRYYINELVSDSQYLYESILDVPLPHSDWEHGGSEHYSTKISSIYEYIELLSNREGGQLSRLLNSSPPKQTVGALFKSGLLVRRVLNACAHLISGGTRSPLDKVNKIANKFKKLIENIEQKIQKQESQLTDYLQSIQSLPTRLKIIASMKIGDSGSGVIMTPFYLNPADSNRISVQLKYRHTQKKRPFIALWSCESESKSYSEFIHLKETSDARYQGEVVIQDVIDNCPMPPFLLVIMRGETPIFRKYIANPQDYARTVD